MLLLTFEFPPYPGGIATYSYQVAANLHSMGVSVVVLATPSTYSYQDDLTFDEAQPFPIRRFRRWQSRPLMIVGRLVETLAFCWRHGVKYVYCCSYKAAYVALFCKVLCGAPFFLVGYGSEYSKRSTARAFIMKQALGLFAISHYTAALMQGQCGRVVSPIPLGADVRHFRPDPDMDLKSRMLREEYGIWGNPILLSVGRLNPRKGHDITLRALERVKAEHQDVQLVIVGRSIVGAKAYEAMLRGFVEKADLTANVKFVSVVSPDALKTFYHLADVFILSSRNYLGRVEGFGIVLIEANLMRTPVVASTSGGIVDAVEDGKSGLLYQCEDPDDLAVKVLSLLRDDSLRLEMGSYGRERALGQFNWQVVAKKTMAAIATMLPEGSDL